MNRETEQIVDPAPDGLESEFGDGMPGRRAGLRERAGAWIESRGPRNFIIGLIVLNAIVIGLQTEPAIDDAIGGLLETMNRAIVAVFVVEITIKLFAFGPRFFRSGWNVFDFLVVGISVIPATGPFEVLRAFRILRVLRLVSQAKHLRQIVESIGRALPGIGWTAFLLLLVFYVFAVIGTELFGETFPQWFGSLGGSMFSLFQVMTLESWSSGIARPVLEVYPLAWLYFVPFILLASFMVLNLFIAIIVSATQSIHQDEEKLERDMMMAELRDINSRLDELTAAMGSSPRPGGDDSPDFDSNTSASDESPRTPRRTNTSPP